MKYIKKYEKINNSDDIEIIAGSYWIIYGDVSNIMSVISKFKKYFPSNDHEIELNRTINRIFRDKDINDDIIGVYLYFSLFGFSYSILHNEDDKLRIYKNQLNANIYDFKGELKIDNNKLVLDDSEKIFLDNINKFNI